MLKVFVTGDNHIGLKYASHEQAAVLASSRITAFEGMVETANQENCALFVITGDLFENTYSVSKREIKTLLDALSCFNGTVVVLPGNHDYYDKDVKVWQYFKDVMTSYDNIMLLTEYHPYELSANGEDVVLKVKTGRIFVELTMESTVKKIEEICKKHIPFGFDINQDKTNYIRKERTVSDRIKYGDADLPDELIGMTDQYSSFEDHVNIVRKDDF